MEAQRSLVEYNLQSILYASLAGWSIAHNNLQLVLWQEYIKIKEGLIGKDLKVTLIQFHDCVKCKTSEIQSSKRLTSWAWFLRFSFCSRQHGADQHIISQVQSHCSFLSWLFFLHTVRWKQQSTEGSYYSQPPLGRYGNVGGHCLSFFSCYKSIRGQPTGLHIGATTSAPRVCESPTIGKITNRRLPSLRLVFGRTMWIIETKCTGYYTLFISSSW